MSFTTRHPTRISGRRLEKNPLVFEGQGMEVEQESNRFEICSELSALLNKDLPSRKSVLPILNQHGFYQSLAKVGEGKYPFPALSVLPASAREG